MLDLGNTPIFSEAWKGKDEPEIIKKEDHYIFVKHRKVKHTGEIKESCTYVPKINVDNLYNIIKLKEIGQKISYYEIVARLKKLYNIDVLPDAWRGGSNCSKYYTKYHYLPLKILEYHKYIRYYGNGDVERLL